MPVKDLRMLSYLLRILGLRTRSISIEPQWSKYRFVMKYGAHPPARTKLSRYCLRASFISIRTPKEIWVLLVSYNLFSLPFLSYLLKQFSRCFLASAGMVEKVDVELHRRNNLYSIN